MTALRGVTVGVRMPLSLRTDLEALARELTARGRRKVNGDELDVSAVVRIACGSLIDRELGRKAPAELGHLDGSPRAHARGPATSKRAAERVWPRANTQRRKALDLLFAAGGAGMTGDELDVKLGGYNGRRRLSELKAGGWVEVRLLTTSGDEWWPSTRLTRQGADAEVYVLTPAAKRRYERFLESEAA